MLRPAVFLFPVLVLSAQTPANQDPKALLRNVQNAIGDRDLVEAYDAASRLDDFIQARVRALMVRDARQRIDEILTWLPAATESLIVSQEPFVFDTNPQRPDLSYLLGRLPSLNSGAVLNSLRGHIVRIAAAAASDIRDRPGGVRGSAVASVVSFFFLKENLAPDFLGASEQGILGRPVWRVTAGRADRTFIARARPDLLVIASSQDLMTEVLIRIARGGERGAKAPLTILDANGKSESDLHRPGSVLQASGFERALPPTLPEWAEVDRAAAFWALRHYTEHLPDSSDTAASGVAVNYDVSAMTMDLRYLSRSNRLPFNIDRLVNRDFQMDRARPGVWVLKTNLRERGASPFGVAMSLMGFGSNQ